MNKKILICYHDDDGCLDGFAAAAVLHDHFTHPDRAEQYKDVELTFKPVSYGDPIPDLTGQTVYIVDFSFDPVALIEAAKVAHHVIILDHHESAKNKWDKLLASKRGDYSEVGAAVTDFYGSTITQYVSGNVRAFFADGMSGSVLTWRYLYANADEFGDWDNPKAVAVTPILLKYCQDWDLHTKKLEGVAEIVAALYARPFIKSQNFEGFIHQMNCVQADEDAMAEIRHVSPDVTHYFQDNDWLTQMYRDGLTIHTAHTTLVLGMIERSVKFVTLAGYKVPVMQCPRELRTLAGGMLAKGHPFAVVYEDCHRRKRREYSFRSDQNDPTSVKVNEIAAKFGEGGGHEHAAGLKCHINDTLIWYQNEAARYAASPHD